MNGLGFGATLSALLGLGAGRQPTMGSADILAPDGRCFTLKPSPFGHRLTLFTADSTTGGHHC